MGWGFKCLKTYYRLHPSKKLSKTCSGLFATLEIIEKRLSVCNYHLMYIISGLARCAHRLGPQFASRDQPSPTIMDRSGAECFWRSSLRSWKDRETSKARPYLFMAHNDASCDTAWRSPTDFSRIHWCRWKCNLGISWLHCGTWFAPASPLTKEASTTKSTGSQSALKGST